MLKIALIVVVSCVVAAAAFVVVKIGPKNVVGMLLYDQRREGDLRVGDQAPDVQLLTLDGKTRVRLTERIGGRTSVLVFGSFT